MNPQDMNSESPLDTSSMQTSFQRMSLSSEDDEELQRIDSESFSPVHPQEYDIGTPVLPNNSEELEQKDDSPVDEQKDDSQVDEQKDDSPVEKRRVSLLLRACSGQPRKVGENTGVVAEENAGVAPNLVVEAPNLVVGGPNLVVGVPNFTIVPDSNPAHLQHMLFSEEEYAKVEKCSYRSCTSLPRELYHLYIDSVSKQKNVICCKVCRDWNLNPSNCVIICQLRR